MVQPNSGLFQGGALLPTGEIGERMAYAFLRVQPGVQKIEDVRKDPAWQRREVDFRVILTGGAVNVEVKSDRHIFQTSNLLFELCRVHHTAKTCAYLGWSVFSEAQRVLVWCPTQSYLYVFDTQAMRAGMQKYVSEAGQLTNVKAVYSDAWRTTINLLVPLRYIPHRIYAHVSGQWAAVN